MKHIFYFNSKVKKKDRKYQIKALLNKKMLYICTALVEISSKFKL